LQTKRAQDTLTQKSGGEILEKISYSGAKPSRFRVDLSVTPGKAREFDL
jgi:hypothetical protein